jgi:hypothetical protein
MNMIRIAVLAIACLVSSSAFALDAAYAGRWRIVEASTAPWWRGAPPPRPLLGQRIVLRDEQMIGRGVLNCGDAAYQTGATPPQGLFQGAMPEAGAVEAAARLGLAGEVPTLEVACDRGLFILHRRGDDLLMAVDNVIYVLRRPASPNMPRDDAAFMRRANGSR